jgi:CRP-like cAMP-binding protein/small-conductance mechanosensitive channel
MLNVDSLPLLLAVAVLSSVLVWRIWPLERRRLYTAWISIALDLICSGLGNQLHAPWLTKVGQAFGELGLVQFGMIALVQIMVRRWTMQLILTDLVAVAGYLLVIFRLLSRLGTDVNGIIATSTVLTAIVGLSMQDMLVNSVSGIVLQFEDEIKQGDFVETEKGSGWIRRVRTRYTALETPNSDVLLVPNQVLTRSTVQVTPISRRIVVPFQHSYEYLPTKVIEEVQKILGVSLPEGVAKAPTPSCFVRSLGSSYVEYGIHLWITSPGQQHSQISETLVRVFFGLARAGMPLKAVTQTVELQEQASRSLPDSGQDASRTILRNADIFRTLTDDELDFLTERLRPASFAPGETIVKQGDEGESVYIVVSGRLRVWLAAEDGRFEQVATIEPGSFFGEMSLLTGEPRSASVVAIDQVNCQHLDRSDFALILERRPELAQEISDVMMERQSALQTARERLNSSGLIGERQSLVARIQNAFRIQRKMEKIAGGVS